MDPFENEAFQQVQLVDAVNRQPYVETDGLAGILPVSETISIFEDIQIDFENGTVDVVPAIERGASASSMPRPTRESMKLPIPIYEEFETIRSLEAIGRRATGSMQTVTLESYRDSIMQPLVQNLIHTRAFQRARGWLYAKILNKNGGVLVDLLGRMNKVQPVVDFDLTNPNFDLDDALIVAKQTSEDALGAFGAERYALVCDRISHSKLRKNKQFKAAAQNPLNVQMQSIDTRKGVRLSEDVDAIEWGRATYTTSQGQVRRFLDDGHAFLVPVGQGLARSVIGPSDIEEYFGNVQEFYAYMERARGGKGQELTVQASFLNYFARPEAVIRVNIIDGSED